MSLSPFLQKSVRAHLWLLLGVQSWDDELPTRSPTLSDQEHGAFLLGQLVLPTAQNFRIDFVRPWKTFGYNRIACAVFCQDFLRVLDQDMYVPQIDEWKGRITYEQARSFSL